MIRRICLTNWRRFRGQNVLDLGPGVYSVVARFEDDAQRSNAGGKSSVIWAIRFALTGETPPADRLADDWITDGEDHGGVGLELDDGVSVVRSRDRGRSTQLLVKVGDGEDMRGDQAQDHLEKHVVGVAKKDLVATCFLDQGEMAAVVKSRPADLHKTASAWFGLEKLEKAARLAGEDLAKQLAVADRLRADIAATNARIDEIAPSATSMQAHADFDQAIDATKHDVARLELEAEAAHRAAAEGTHQVQRVRNAAEYRGLAAEGKKLRAELVAVDIHQLRRDVENRAEDLALERAKVAAHERSVREREALVGGVFNGVCPVNCRPCPVADEVVADKNAAAEALAASRDALKGAVVGRTHSLGLYEDARSELAQAEKLGAEFAAKRDRSRLLAADKDVPEDAVGLVGLQERARDAADRAAEARAHLRELERARDRLDELLGHRDDVQRDLDAVALKTEVARHACEVLGRQGAQRIVAESALGAIREEADQALAEAGIAQRVLVSWCRDAASGLATHCSACGTPHPRSQRAKACARCGAARGPKVVEELSVKPSTPSGAYDDLVGIFFQLAASVWLRRARGGWPVLAMDEPCGALDAANRAAFSGKIARMLTERFGFEQAFVVAHSPEVRDAMPNRIQIVAGEGGSRFAGEGETQ